MQRGLHIICDALKNCGNLAAFWAFGVYSPNQQALNRDLDESARRILAALWLAGAPSKSEERELKACYSSTARDFNCESVNLNL